MKKKHVFVGVIFNFRNCKRVIMEGVGILSEKYPKVFISYCWENEEHIQWVKNLADLLLSNGVDVTLDQYDVSLGDRIPHFMETSIANTDYVLVVCTEEYKKKSDGRLGGVGYETHIISGELVDTSNERKFIPIIRKGTVKTSLPDCLKGKFAIDLSKDFSPHDAPFQDLIVTLYGKNKKPKIGTPPDYISENTRFDINKKNGEILIGDVREEIKILGIITTEVTSPKLDGTVGSALYKIPFRLSKTPSKLWSDLFITNWNNPPIWTTMHRPNTASIEGDKIILNRTTIEEVQDVHRDTLLLCVEKSNKEEYQLLEEERRIKELKIKQEKKHIANINEKSKEIIF